MLRILPGTLALVSAACLAVSAQVAPEERPLDHEAYARWHTLESPRISNGGHWVAYALEPGDAGDGRVMVRSVTGDASHVIERGAGARIAWDEGWVVCKVQAPRAERHAAELEERDDDERPKAGLALLDLATGEVETVERVKSFALPRKDGRFVAWLHEKPVKDDDEEDAEESEESETAAAAEESAPAEVAAESSAAGEGEPEVPEQQPGGEQPTAPEAEVEEPEPEQTPEERAAERKAKRKQKGKQDGTPLVLRELATGEERRFEDVTAYEFSEDGRWLAYTTGQKDEDADADGAWVVSTAGGEPVELLAGYGRYDQLVFDEAGERLAFLSNTADWASDEPAWSLYTWTPGAESATTAVGLDHPSLAEGWAPSPHREPRFSKSGGRLYFGTAPRTRPEPEPIPKDDRVVVDVWSWTDDRIQPQQLSELEDEEQRSYLAVLHLGDEPRLVQLGAPGLPEVSTPLDGESAMALGVTDLPYRRMLSWDVQLFQDVFAIDVETGMRSELQRGRRGSFRLSPGGHWVSWWDAEQRTWFVQPTSGGEAVDVSSAIGQRMDNELHDTPQLPGSHGSAGWLADDAGLLLYDRYDLWLVDPNAPGSPRCLTEGVGRREGLRFRLVDLDREAQAIDPDEPLLLASFDRATKDAGFHRDTVSGDGEPIELVRAAASFSTPIKAEEADVLMYRRGSFEEFDDLWTADLDLGGARRVSDANPQQDEYLWGTAELVHWTSADGTPLDGILYKPADFDPARKYPMITYFYERVSDRLHAYSTPIPHRSIIRFSFYASRGYLVFCPDIPYETGEPGPSAMNAVVPGVLELVNRGFVDPDAIGIQGHSWGGYQAAYLITQTDLFAAAGAGAVVSNMTSAYGGIRWESGMSRQFQYEKTQSRIGGTLWEATHDYLDNSPVFFADEVNTPLLMMHNDHDGAVPWYQGIEYFMALRRLGKPVWMLNYNDQPHWVITTANQRDYATRMQQFFDHYLRGAPAPRWMVEGVPAIEKGRTLGLELVDPAESSGS